MRRILDRIISVIQKIASFRARFTRSIIKRPLPRCRSYSGLIGCGYFARFAYAPVLSQYNPPIVCSGLYSRSIRSARGFQNMLAYKSVVYPHFEDLIESGISNVIITIPNHVHYHYILECLKKNLDVFCEKPVANTLDHAYAVEGVVKETGRVLMVGFNLRYLDVILKLKSLINEGEIGTIMNIRTFYNLNIEQHLRQSDWLNDANKSGGGVIHNSGIHFVNIMLFLLGPIVGVSAEFKNLTLPSSFGEDTAFCKFAFKSGSRGFLDASFVNAVDSSKGDIILGGSSGTMAVNLAGGLITVRDKSGAEKIVHCVKQNIPDSICSELRHFHSCVENRTTPETDIVDSIETLKITEAIKMAAIEHREIHIGETLAGS